LPEFDQHVSNAHTHVTEALEAPDLEEKVQALASAAGSLLAALSTLARHVPKHEMYESLGKEPTSG
jgi:hypothetical protein